MSTRDDQLTAALPDYRRWLHHVANEMLPPTSAEHDDLVQEGYIAMWRALDSFDESKGALPSWLTRAARYRMLDVRRGRALTGAERDGAVRTTDVRGVESRRRIREHLAEHPAATGREIARALGMSEATVSVQRKRLDVDGEAPALVSLDGLVEQGGDVPGGDDTVDTIIEAYHDGAVAQALDLLTEQQRRYVVLRFWHGYGTTALAREFGYDPRGVWKGAQARLRAALADLVAA